MTTLDLVKVAPTVEAGESISAELEALDEELRDTLAASVAPATTRPTTVPGAASSPGVRATTLCPCRRARRRWPVT